MVAMSGGVDSSLTAVLLREQGHDVTGVTLHLWDGDDDNGLRESQCCSQEMVAGARRVCAQYDMPFYVFNYQREFRRTVIQYFVDEYANGFTPNPCLVCNRDIKFRALLDRAQKLGFDAIATGHYARIVREDGAAQESNGSAPRYALLRGVDTAKDQSYVLYMLRQADLARILFPLGELTKAQVRELAQERGLVTADRPESQDICFVPDNDYRSFVHAEAPDAFRPGPIIDHEGHEIGRHLGLPHYTVGQRRGLGVQTARPVYVTALDTERNALIVGYAEQARQSSCIVEQIDFVSGQIPDEPFACEVQVRIHGTPFAARVVPLGGQQARLEFDTPQRAITPGQAAVFYDGARVLGGGRIARPPHEETEVAR
jgi:tRNA-specific 2-thiouridylase